MPELIGVFLAVAVALVAWAVGLDRDRALYPIALIVIASYYILFASIGGSTAALRLEGLIFVPFAAAAIVGFRTSLWVVVAGLAGHGLHDFFLQSFVGNAGVVPWWPGFCGAYDVAAAVCLAVLLVLRPAIRTIPKALPR